VSEPVQPQWWRSIELSNEYAAETPIWVDGGLLVDLDLLGSDSRSQLQPWSGALHHRRRSTPVQKA